MQSRREQRVALLSIKGETLNRLASLELLKHLERQREISNRVYPQVGGCLPEITDVTAEPKKARVHQLQDLAAIPTSLLDDSPNGLNVHFLFLESRGQIPVEPG